MDAQSARDILNMDHSELIAEGEPAQAPDLDAENLEVNKTLRLSMAMAQAVESEARRQGVKPSVLMRAWIEEGLRRSAERPANLSVPLEDLLRVVQQLARPDAA
ncbi:hypothetical protein LWF15_07695 [Kineosporia rhizophila]|uniref:hypothetical protein n=1 Tax=Kineosporia TaxID=49184 RepID=UPI000A7FE44D|nr:MULTISPECIES: hypothetical protein [Kineosporia]MCE0535390.1 hypothetical protein [Kineosporia rhizophila]GLY16829.1 hypothetical protein Kisp01_38440 [Kineosporia sp. NBRC 101677]